jgi:hypothetical protein
MIEKKLKNDTALESFSSSDILSYYIEKFVFPSNPLEEGIDENSIIQADDYIFFPWKPSR